MQTKTKSVLKYLLFAFAAMALLGGIWLAATFAPKASLNLDTEGIESIEDALLNAEADELYSQSLLGDNFTADPNAGDTDNDASAGDDDADAGSDDDVAEAASRVTSCTPRWADWTRSKSDATWWEDGNNNNGVRKFVVSTRGGWERLSSEFTVYFSAGHSYRISFSMYTTWNNGSMWNMGSVRFGVVPAFNPNSGSEYGGWVASAWLDMGPFTNTYSTQSNSFTFYSSSNQSLYLMYDWGYASDSMPRACFYLNDIVIDDVTQYWVGLDQQGGWNGTTGVAVEINAPMPNIAIPTRTGYTFQGYWGSPNQQGDRYYWSNGTSAKNWPHWSGGTVYAHWTPNTYAVTLNRNGGSGGTASVTATYNAGMPAISVPSRSNYTFLGYWDTAANTGGTQYYNASGGSTRSWTTASGGTLYARWALKAAVVYDANGGAEVVNNIHTMSGTGVVATLNGRNYTKVSSGLAYYSTLNATSYSYPWCALLVSEAQAAAVYQCSHCSTNCGTGSFTWGGKTYYYSEVFHSWQNGDQYDTSYNSCARVTGTDALTCAKNLLRSRWVNVGATIGTFPANPTRTGYTFLGWFTAASGGTQVTTSTTVSSRDGMTVYAHWSPDYVAVEFDPNDGEMGVVNTTTMSTAGQLIATINGRNYNKTNAGAAYYCTLKRTDNWCGPFLVSTNSSYVSFTSTNNPGGDGSSNGSIVYNGVTYYYSNIGSAFSGDWYDYSANGCARLLVPDHVTAAIKLLRSKIVRADGSTQLGTLPTPTRTGYTFAGWYTAASGGTQIGTTQTYTGRAPVTYYAHWTAASYTVSFNTNKPSNASNTPSAVGNKSVTYTSTYGTLTNSNLTGWTLQGWSLLPAGYTQLQYIQGTGTQYIDTGYKDTLGVTVDYGAKWTSSELETTMVGSLAANSPHGRNLGTLASNGTWILAYGDYETTGGSSAINTYYDVRFRTVINRAYINVNGTCMVTNTATSTICNENILLFYHQYAAAVGRTKTRGMLYYVTIYNHSGTLVRHLVPARRDSDGAIGMVDIANITNNNVPFYTNAGTGSFVAGPQEWVADASGTTGNTVTSTFKVRMPANHTLYARWTVNTYTVTLNQQGGSGGTASVTATYDSAMPSATMPTRTGYTFGGYYDATGGSGTQYYTAGGASARTWNKTTNSELHAKWTAITYTIAFAGNGNTSGSMSSITATYDANSQLTANAFAKTGYSFAGWKVTSGLTTDTTSKRALDNQYENTTTNWNNYGIPVTASTLLGNRCYVKNLRTTSGTVTLTAQWTANVYTMTFNANGGSVSPTTKSVTYGQTYTDLPTPTRTGYTFKGWGITYVSSSSTYLNMGRDYMYTDKYSIHLSAYRSDWATSNSNYEMLYSSTNGSDGGNNIYLKDAKLIVDTFPTTGSYVRISIDRNTISEGWHDFDIVHNGTTVTLYIDGVQKGQVSCSGARYHNANSYFVGGDSATSGTTPRAGRYFNGILCNVIFSNTNARITSNLLTSYTAPAQNATLYAQWQANTINPAIVYNKGWASSGTVPASQSGVYDQTDGITLATNNLTKDRATANTYSITFNANGGSTTVSSATAKKYTNYSANGWNTSDNQTSPTTGYTSGAKITVTWTSAKNLYPAFSTYASYDDATTPTTSQATRTGYTLTKWTTNSNGSGASYDPGATIAASGLTNNITLYAQWTANTYTIAFAGGTGATGSMSNLTATYNTPIQLTGNGFSKTGHTFTGWKATDGLTADSTNNRAGAASNSLTTTVVANSTVINNEWYVKNLRNTSGTVTLTAQWSVDQYTLTVNAVGAGGSVTVGGTTYNNQKATVTQNYGTTVTVSTPTRTGYRNPTWTLTGAGSISGTTFTFGAGNATLTANWTANTYTIAYSKSANSANESGDLPANQSATYDTNYTLGSNGLTTTKTDTRTYTITYKYNYTNAPADTTATSNGTKGYVSNGWNTAQTYASNNYVATGTHYNSAQTNVKNLTSTQGATVTLYAQFSPAADNTWSQSAVTTPNPTRTGYTFAGWYTDATNGTKAANGNASYTPTGNINLYAHWTAKTYTVTFNTNKPSYAANNPSAANPTSKTVTYDSTYGDLAATTLTGFTLDGWYTAASGGTKITSSTKVSITDDQTLYAHWNVSNYTITVNPSGGVARKNLAYMKTGSGSNTRANYAVSASGVITVTGNTSGNNDNYAHLLNTGPYANIELNGSAYKNYTFTTKATSSLGTSLQVYWFKYNASANTVSGPWFSYTGLTSGTGVNNVTRTEMTATNGTPAATLFNMRVDPDTYNNVATLEDLAIYETATSYNNTNYTISLPCNHIYYLIPPTKTGYTFSGWTVSGTGSSINGNILTVGTANTTVTATWTANTYTVKFNPKGSGETYTTGGSMANQTFTYDASQTLTANTFTRTGYTFAGWSTSSAADRTKTYDNQQSVSNLTATAGGTVNLYAVWTANKYTITLSAQLPADKNGGGAGTTSFVLLYGTGYYTNNNVNVTIGTSASDKVTVPTAGGYTFRGYYSNQNTNGIVENGITPTGTLVVGTDGLIKVSNTFFSANNTIYGVWYHNTYNVTYNINGGTSGTLPNNQSGLYKSTITLGTNNIGWTNTELATITFAYNIDQYSSVNSASPTKPNSITAPANATVKTYQKWIKDGWYTTSTGTGGTAYADGTQFTIPASDTTLYAKKKTNGQAYNSVTLPTPAAWTGRTFLGWYTAPTGGTLYGAAGAQVEVQETTTKTITLYARWQYKTATISGDVTPAGYGTVSGAGTYTYGDTWSLSATANENNEFYKWVENTSGNTTIYEKGNNNITPPDGITVSADGLTISGTMGEGNRSFVAYYRALQDTINGTTFYYTVTSESPKTCTLNRVKMSAAGTLTIPEKINGYTITAMRNGSQNDNITYLKTGDGVAGSYNKTADTATRGYITGLVLDCTSCTNIGNRAFYATNLAGTVTMPSSMRTIGYEAFRQSKVVRMELNEGLTKIDNRAFCKCQQMTYINIPSTVNNITKFAFSWTVSLTTFDLNASNTTYTLYNDIIYTKNHKTLVAYPCGKANTWSTNGVPNANIFHSSMENILDAAFWGARNITGVLVIPAGNNNAYKTINETTFADCYGTTGIVLGSNVTKVITSAFSACTGVNTRLVIPANLKNIGKNAFTQLTNCPEVLFMHSAISDVTFGDSGEFTAGKSGVVYMFRDIQANVNSWGKFTTTHFTNTTYHYATKITYNANGGTLSGATDQYAYSGGAFTTHPASVVSRDNYDSITSWNTASGGTGDAYTVGTEYTSSLTSDTTFYADWRNRGHVYTITLNHNSGTLATTAIYQKYASGYYTTSACTTAVGTIKPTRTGYTFGGYNAGNTQVINANGAVTAANTYFTSDTTINAQWTANTYTIAFAGNTGATGSMSNLTATYDTPIQLTANGFSKTGYTFDGWKVTSNNINTTTAKYGTASNNCTTALTTSTVVGNQAYVLNLTDVNTRTVTLTAQWTANTYTVKFDKNSASAALNNNATATMADQTFTYNAAQTLSANAYTRVGYSFASWNTKADGAGTSYDNQQSVSNLVSTAGGSITLYAQWNVNSYTLTLDANGGSVSQSTKSVTYGQTYTDLPTPTRTGYTFKGWATDHDGTSSTAVQLGRAYMYTDKISIHFSAYRDSWSTAPSDYVDFVSCGQNAGIWIYFNTSAKFQVGVGKTGSGYESYTHSTTLTAGWHDFDIVFNGTNFIVYIDGNQVGSKALGSSAITYHAVNSFWIGANPNATQTGFDNGHFFTGKIANVIIENENARITNNLLTSFTAPAQDLTLKAVWEANTYTIRYNKSANSANETGSVPADVTATYGESYNLGTNNLTTSKTDTRSYDVTFIRNYTSSDNTQTGKLTSNGTKGYTANGWNTEQTYVAGNYVATGTHKNNGASVSNLATSGVYNFYAEFQPVANWTQAAVTAPTPSRTGYNFNGWYSARTGGSKVVDGGAEYTPNGDVSLYARWTAITYTIAFAGGTGATGSMSNLTATYDSPIQLTANGFSKTGYTFAGWKATNIATDNTNQRAGPNSALNTSDDVVVSTSTVIANNWYVKNLRNASGTVTLTAQWDANGYEVTFDVNKPTESTENPSAASPTSIMATYNETYGTLATTSLTGWNFAGWFTSPSGGTQVTSSTTVTITSAQTLYAHWTAKPVTVTYYKGWASTNTNLPSATASTFDHNITLAQNTMTRTNGVTTRTVTFNYNYTGAPANTTQDATRTYQYTASGWTTSEAETFTNTYASAATFKWYFNTGATTMSLYPVFTREIVYADVTLPTPTRTGYTFGGWFSNSGCTGTSYNGGANYRPNYDVEAGPTFYAKWTANTYTVVFDKNATSATGTMANQTFTYDVAQNLTANAFSRTGYTFNKWNTEANGSGTNYTNGQSVSNLVATAGGSITLYAQWTAKQYTVTLDANGGVLSGSTADKINVTTTTCQYHPIYDDIAYQGMGTLAERTGYTFTGWWSAQTGGVQVYRDNGGCILNSGYYNADGKWCYDGNPTFYAQWTANTYTVVFNKNADSATGTMANQTFTYDVAQNLTSNAFARTGYTFNGWNTDSGGMGTAYTNGQSVTNLVSTAGGSITLYAQWTAITYTIIFNKNATSATGTMANQTFTYDVPQNLTANAFSRTGYTFDSWNTNTGGTGTAYTNGQSVVNLTTVQGTEIQLYAIWTANAYTLSFNAMLGSVTPTSKRVVYDTAIGDLPTPVRAGYTFDGWFTGETGGTQVTSSTVYKTTADSTVYARWTANTYTVHYDANGGTGTMADQTFTYDEAQNLTANAFTRTGYTFSGWATANNTPKVYDDGQSVTNLATSGSITLYAVWTINNYNIYYLKGDYAVGGTLPSTQTAAYNSSVTLATNSMTRANDTKVTYNITYNYNADNNYSVSTKTNDTTTYQWSYVANGWNTVGNRLGKNLTTNTGTARDYASGASYTIPANDTTLYANLDYNEVHNSVTLPTPAARTGYTFDGWYDAATNGNLVGAAGASYTPSGETSTTIAITLYAHWTINQYDVTYERGSTPNGTVSGAVPTKQTGNYGASVTLRTNSLSKADYVQSTYTLTYNYGDGSGSKATDTGHLTLKYTPNGWNTDASRLGKNLTQNTGNNPDYASGASYTIPSSNTTLYPNFDYNETLDTITLPNATRTGYAFSGWYTASTGGERVGVAGASYTITGTTTLYARYLVNTYTVILEDYFASYNGSAYTNVTLLGTANNTYTYGTTAKGSDWGTDATVGAYYAGYAYKAYSTAVVNETNQTKVYRYFAAVTNITMYDPTNTVQSSGGAGTFTVNYGGTTLNNQSASVNTYPLFSGSTITISNITPANGMVLSSVSAGISANLSNSNDTYTYTVTTALDTISIYMAYKVYTINLDKDNSNATSGTVTIYEKYNTGYYSNSTATTPITTITTPTLTGHTFKGYYTVKNNVLTTSILNQAQGEKVIDEDGTILKANTYFSNTNTANGTTKLYALWLMNTYTITGQPNNAAYGSVTGTGDYLYGATWTLTAVPNENCEFYEWRENNTLFSTDLTITGTTGTADRTFTAYFRPLSAEISGTTFYYTVTSESPKTCTLNRVKMSASGILTIPDTLNGYTITAMRNGTRTDNITYLETADANVNYNKVADTATRTRITGLVLNCTHCANIGLDAFYNCTNLTGSVSIPNSVTVINNEAFRNTRITSAQLGNNVANINWGAFISCTQLASINIPASVTSIGALAFGYTDSLTTFNLDSNNATYTLYNDIIYTTDYTRLVACPSGKTGVWSTNGTVNTNIFRAGVTSMAGGAFCGASHITGTLIIPSTITTIPGNAFEGATGITEVKLHNSITAIGSNAFINCAGINTRLVIPASVTLIDAGAFNNCYNMPEVLFMHSSISTLSLGANREFTQGKSGVAYIFRDTQAHVTSWGNFTTTHFTNTTFHYATKITFNSNGGDKTIDPIYAYNNFTTPSDAGDNIILESWNTNALATGTSYNINTEYAAPSADITLYAIWTNGITTVGNATYKFHITNRSNKTCELDTVLMSSAGALVVPNKLIDYTITTMRDTADYTNGENGGVFTQVVNYMQSIDLSNLTSLTNIGRYAFKDTHVTSIIIPSTVTTLSYGAFWNMPYITTINIPANVTNMGGAFGSNAALTSFTIANGNTTYKVVDDAVYNMAGTTLVAYPTGKTSTWADAIPSGVTHIGAAAFRGATHITGAFELPESVTYINGESFSGASITGEVTLPSNLTTVEWNAFNGTQITKLTIPASVTRIAGAFRISTLTRVHFLHSNISTLTLLDAAFTNDNANVIYAFYDYQSSVNTWGRFTNAVFTNTTYHQLYKVTYDSNGGNGTNPGFYDIAGSVYTTPTSAGTYTANADYRIIGWNTAANGSGTNYGLGVDYNIPAQANHDFTLYAVWHEPVSVTITTNLARASVSANITNVPYGSSQTVTTTCNDPDFTFLGWYVLEEFEADNVNAVALSANASYTFNVIGNVNLMAAYRYSGSTDVYIGDLAKLVWLQNVVNGGISFAGINFYLNTDLNLDDIIDADWVGIGNATYKFAGTFDGRGYTITSAQALNLFATGTTATVRNLHIGGSLVANVTITDDNSGLND